MINPACHTKTISKKNKSIKNHKLFDFFHKNTKFCSIIECVKKFEIM